MRTYRHFTRDDREMLFILNAKGLSQTMIAKTMGFSQSAISRELKRNQDLTTVLYVPELAQQMALRRKRRDSRIDRYQALKTYILEHLQLYWSPDVIAGRLKLTTTLPTISTEAIYQWIYKRPQHKDKLYKYLARHKSKRGRRQTYTPKPPVCPEKTSIHMRPNIINNRMRLGDWEGDLIIGKYHKSQALTLSERISKFVMIKKLHSKKVEEVTAVMQRALTESGAPVFSTTLDNGTEFNGFQQLATSLNIDVFFCDAYASWQKGGIEHVNGIIRRTIPKRTCLNQYSDQDLDDLAWTINNTPRKSLAFRTPYEVLFSKNYPKPALCTCN